MKNLKERAMLVNLHISVWGARKYDRNVTREIERLHGADDTGRFNKILMKNPVLDEIKSLTNKARAFHRDATLPWGDDNARIITTDKYFDYLMVIGQLTMQVNELVEKQFLPEYQNFKEKEKERLKTMFKETDYPDREEIADKFKMKAIFSPISDETDFRVGLNDSIVENMKTQLKNELNDRVKNVTIDLLERINLPVITMIEKLKDGGVFRDSLVNNIQDICNQIPLYNFTDNPELIKVTEMAKVLFVDPDMLRNNDGFRKDIIKKAQNVKEYIDETIKNL